MHLRLLQFGGPFQVMTGTGPVIVLPNRYADEIRNNPLLSFTKFIMKVCQIWMDGWVVVLCVP